LLGRRHDTQPSSQPTLPFQIGEMVAGKYRVESIVGLGGMAAVIAATHIELDQKVAVKILLPERAKEPDAIRRFVTEARAAAKLKSDHAARISDVGTASTPGGVVIPYLVMELLEGEDLATYIERRGRLSPSEAVDFVLEACDAVQEAHSLNIVHRDIKPPNLFVSKNRDGESVIKLLDFGISKTVERTAPHKSNPSKSDVRSITGENEVMGSPAYMSPEQIRAMKDVDHRTDIWSLGVVLYELLTGRDAFQGTSIQDVMGNVVHTEPDRLESIAPDIPRALSAAVHRCLAKDRAQRFQSIAELVDAICPFASNPRELTGPVAIAVEPHSHPKPIALPPNDRAAPTVLIRPRKSPPAWMMMIGAGVLVLLILGGVVAAAMRGPSSTTTPNTTTTISPPPIATAPASAASSASSLADEPDIDLPDTAPSSSSATPRRIPGRPRTKPAPSGSAAHHRTTW
jgi:eukaryotic-like serine/threonine-protein kinase